MVGKMCNLKIKKTAQTIMGRVCLPFKMSAVNLVKHIRGQHKLVVNQILRDFASQSPYQNISNA